MRFHGFVGFCIQTETAPDVWKPVPSEKEYYSLDGRRANYSHKGIVIVRDGKTTRKMVLKWRSIVQDKLYVTFEAFFTK